MSICVASDIETEDPSVRRVAGRPASVLVVDDYLPGRIRIRLPTPDPGRLVSRYFDCRSLDEGMAAARCIGFDLVLLDPGLPDAAAMRAVTAMRAALPDAWIAVVSHLLDARAASACLAAGADDAVPTVALSDEAFDRLLIRAARHRGDERARPAVEVSTPAAPSPAARRR